MRAVAATIGCGLAMSGGILIVAAAQDPPAQAPPAAPTIFERQWNHAIGAPGQLAIAAGAARVFVTDDENGVEARAVTDGALIWQAQLPSDLPVAVAGDQIFVVSGGQLHALEEATGRARWARPLQPSAVALVRHDTGVIAAGGKAVRAWSAGGNLVWERTLAGDVGRELLAIDGSSVYLGLTDLTLVALDAATGAPKWIERIGTLPLGLTAVGGKVYFGGTDQNLHAYDRGGGLAWTYHRVNVVGAPAVDSELVYVALWDNTVEAHAKSNGHLKWRRPLDNRPARGPMLSPPFVVAMLSSDEVVAMPTASDKPAAARAGGPPPAPPAATAAAAAPPARNRVLVATPSADGNQVFAVIQLENRDRVVVAYKRN